MAIEAFERSLDFADALHLGRASRAAAFVTFDRTLAKRAAALGSTLPVELLK
jgi:predicted nucleic acid-binding protein